MTTEQRTATATWAIDKTHSAVEFSVKHLMISTVKGSFRDFDATLYIDEVNPENSWVKAVVDVASIDTNVPDRDAHLRSDDFFNADEFPQMKLGTKRVERLDSGGYRLIGELTIRDVTKEVPFDIEYEGRIQDPWGNERIAFNASATISRREFNVRWNQAIEAGGVAVGDAVKIRIYVEAIRQA